MAKRCTLCQQTFRLDDDHDHADVLDHWAREHNDHDVFWRVVGDARTWVRCGGCAEMFPSEIQPHNNGLAARLYCDDCSEDGLDNKVKALVATDVTARYVLDHEVRQDV